MASGRLISDWQIQQIHRRNGVIGLMTWKQKLKQKSYVDINDFVDHICYIADLTGSVDNIAIGSRIFAKWYGKHRIFEFVAR